MVASLFRVLTTGIQDERLQYSRDGVPPETWTQFTKVWMRTGRFTTRWHRIDFTSIPDFGRNIVCDIPLKGEFITRMFLVSTLPDIGTAQAAAVAAAISAGGDGTIAPTFSWTNAVGHAIVQKAQFLIGGNIIDELDRNLLEVLDEFNTPLEKTTVMNRLIARADNGFGATTFSAPGTKTLYTPLPFWFTRGDSACALPVDAIRVDSLRVQIKLAPLSDLYYTDSKILPPGSVQPSTDNTPTEIKTNTTNPVVQVSACGGGVRMWNIEASQLYYPCTTAGGGEAIPGLAAEGPVCPTGNDMPSALPLQDCYLLIEYVYVDKPEANRFRLADIQIPITTHTALPTFDTQGLPLANIPIRVGNPVRNMYWFAQRVEAALHNDWFSASRDLLDIRGVYWWPNAQGLSADVHGALMPAWATRDTEPLRAIQLSYEGSLARVGSQAPALFRSILPSLECKKSPWIHRYYYMYPFGIYNNMRGVSAPCGQANMDKLERIQLQLEFSPQRGYTTSSAIPRYNVYIWVEEYNILRIFGGRAGLLFDN